MIKGLSWSADWSVNKRTKVLNFLMKKARCSLDWVKCVTADNNTSEPPITTITASQRSHPHNTHPTTHRQRSSLHLNLQTPTPPQNAPRTPVAVFITPISPTPRHVLVSPQNNKTNVHLPSKERSDARHQPNTIDITYKWLLKGFHSDGRKKYLIFIMKLHLPVIMTQGIYNCQIIALKTQYNNINHVILHIN